MPNHWDQLTKSEQHEARELRTKLATAGIHTTVSQIAAAWTDVQSWTRGRLHGLDLCHRHGWSEASVLPEYFDHPDKGLTVYTTRDAYTAARDAARDRDHAGEPPTLGLQVNTQAGGTEVQHLPVLTARLRNGDTREQVLTRRTWSTPKAPGVLLAEIPINRAHHPQRGVPCALCDAYGAPRLRRDRHDRPGLLCHQCVQDMSHTTWPLA